MLRLSDYTVMYRGMRLALPDKIKGIPVKHIQAYDCSENANIVRSQRHTDPYTVDRLFISIVCCSYLLGWYTTLALYSVLMSIFNL